MFWLGLLLILVWGGWGYARRRWWLREINRSLDRRDPLPTVTDAFAAAPTRYHPPTRLALPDRLITLAAIAAGVIGYFLVIGSWFGWFA